MSPNELNNEELSRYSRHLLLPEIDFSGQQRISAARVTIIGAGGLGSPAALYLAGSGVGSITLFDDDEVDLGNLQRQIAYRTDNVGQNKAETLATALRALNPQIHIHANTCRAESDALSHAVAKSDVIIDASDNFDTRFSINDACVNLGTPLVSGAAIRFQGQVSVFTPGQNNSPCYRCLYRDEDALPAQSCEDHGVFSPLTGIVGSIQAAETLKLLLDSKTTLTGKLLQINATSMEFRTSRLLRDPACPACSGKMG